MPGIQSNSTPQQRPEQRADQWPENRDRTAPSNGPLEAAKRSPETRKGNPGSPPRHDIDTDGRPGWLKRWAGESRRDTDLQATREVPNPERGLRLPKEDAASDLQRESALSQGAEAVAGPSNGHTGHSIEAAFDFETVFHFETDLEAESTDDWLDLSDEEPHSAAEEDSRAGDRDNLAEVRHSLEHASDPDVLSNSSRPDDRTATSPDPKAVRAAIFRLAQQSHGGQIAKPQSANTPEGGAERLTSMTPEGGFAEVARRVWAGSGTVTRTSPDSATAGGYGPLGELPSSVRTSWNQASHGPFENQQAGAGSDQHAQVQSSNSNLDESLASEAIHPADPNPAQNSFTEQKTAAFEPNEVQGEDKALAHRDAVDSGAAAMDARHTVDGGLSNPLEAAPRDSHASSTRHAEKAELASDLRSPLESKQADAQASAQESPLTGGATEAQPPSGPVQEGVQQHGEAQGRASGGPALAHDAGNLLSALKLYSELLALSGVLHARHKHYAEDLKLLASRSEALIDRLLASCNLAERQAQQLLQESANRNVADAAATVSGLPSTYSGLDEQPLSTGQLASAPLLPDEDRPGTRKADTAGTRAGERLDASFVEAAERTQAIAWETDKPANAGVYGATSRDGQDFACIGARPALDLTEDGAGALAKAEENRPSPVNLVELLTRWGSLLSMIARGSVQVKFGSQAALPVQVAEEALERILVNLVHNAMTATRGGGAIRIGVGRAETRRLPHNEVRARPGNRMVLTVDDSGCGMTEEQIAKALGLDQHTHKHASLTAGHVGAAQGQGGAVQGVTFPSASNRLSSASNAETHRNGTRGMGLQIVRELVAVSGGELVIFSRVGVGTRIEIQWPTVEPVSGLERIPPASVGTAAVSLKNNYAGGRDQHQAVAFNDDTADSAHIGSFSVYDRTTQQRLNVPVEGAVAC